MLSLRSIWAVVLRHILLWREDPNTILFTLYWPILDILIWGFLGAWIAQSQAANQLHNYESVALLGILLWQVVGRGCNSIILSLTEELWSGNIVNLFSLPLRTSEWIAAVMVTYAIMIVLTAAASVLIISLLYSVSLWCLLSTFLIFLPPLFLSGIWLGFICLQIIISLGRKSIELGFIIGWALLPFSGAYYPLEILPSWGQKLSSYLPMSYVFQAMRGYVMHGQNPTAGLIKGYILSTIYALCSVMLFVFLFNRSKQKGLARLKN